MGTLTRPGIVAIFALLLAPVVLAGVSATGARTQASRPNVVLIATDDQGFGDLGRSGEIDCHDPAADPANCQHPLETAVQDAGLEGFTPNLDLLSREGVRFSDFHVTPLCAPTRAALMTGRFNHRTGVLFPVNDRQILSPDETTLAELLRQAGYRTAMFGKWNLGENTPSRPQDRGFDEVLKLGPGAPQVTADYWRNDCFGDTYFDENDHGVTVGPNHDPPQPGDPYCTDVFFDAARSFISDHVAQAPDQPFFVYIPTIAPHDIRTASPRPFSPPNDPDPSVVYESLGVDPVLADFYGAIHGVDEQLGELRSFLQGMDLEDNTILVVLGDNGSQLTMSPSDRNLMELLLGYRIVPSFPAYADFVNPAGLLGSKGDVYEGGHRVFLFMRWPDGGVTGDAVAQIDALTHVGDLLPTLLDLAEIEIDPGLKDRLDGISLKPLLSGESGDAFDQRTVFVQGDFGAEDPTTGAFTPRPLYNFAVLTPEWRLVHPDAGDSELYAASDRGQATNVALANPGVVADLESRWSAYYAEWVGLYDDPGDRGRISIGDPRARTQALASSAWLATNEALRGFSSSLQDGISAFENATPSRGFWALDVARAGDYSIKLRRWPDIDHAPASVADQPIDPRGGGSARLVISPEYFDVDTLSLTGAGGNFVDLTNALGASDAESEFVVPLEQGDVFLGGELTGVREFASGCDVNVDPAACPEVLRSPYFAAVSLVPEPSALLLRVFALAALAWCARRESA
jgi:arylsulfatase A-like enzyme